MRSKPNRAMRSNHVTDMQFDSIDTFTTSAGSHECEEHFENEGDVSLLLPS